MQHLDACLGCRGCEPVCPSGVGYGRGLERARERLSRTTGFRRRRGWCSASSVTCVSGGRCSRSRGRFGALASHGGSPAGDDWDSAWGCWVRRARHSIRHARVATRNPHAGRRLARRPSSLFRGCVMDTLFGHVHAATRRTLEANGYRVREVDSQVCCGALHEHAGDRAAAARWRNRTSPPSGVGRSHRGQQRRVWGAAQGVRTSARQRPAARASAPGCAT